MQVPEGPVTVLFDLFHHQVREAARARGEQAPTVGDMTCAIFRYFFLQHQDEILAAARPDHLASVQRTLTKIQYGQGPFRVPYKPRRQHDDEPG